MRTWLPLHGNIGALAALRTCAAAAAAAAAALHVSSTAQECSWEHITQAVNEDGRLAWTPVTVLRSFKPRLPDTPFLRMTTSAGQVGAACWVVAGGIVQ
jgi:hypothetical protein